MNPFYPTSETSKSHIQSRLMILAAAFLFLGCVILTLAPAVRVHNWNAEYRWQQWVGFITWIICFTFLFRDLNRFLPDHDPYLLPVISILSGWGILMIYRLTPYTGFRQTAWLAVSTLAVLVALRIPSLLAILRRYKYVWLLCGILLTGLTFFFGTYPGGIGPNLWLGCCGVYLQPSEILKFLLIIYLAAYMADSLPAKFRLVQLLAPTLVIVSAALMILVAQRDLGTASLFVILYTVIIYLASGKRRILLISFILVIFALIAAYLVFDVIQLRIEAWLNPWLDSRGKSYQLVQSIIAIANGGLLGRGPGLGSPNVVPVAHSDFIYTAILEEFGLTGGIVLVSILAFFAIRGITLSLHAPNQFQRFLGAGLTAYLSTQAILIIGGNIRLLPLTGVTLPFMSYGGTSLLVSFLAGFLLLVISNQSEDHPAFIERSKPYVLIGMVLLAGFTAIALMTSWWSFFRSGDLLDRVDNPRRAISDWYVYRGVIFDRNETPLTLTSGDPGAFERTLVYPHLSSVIGYSNANYGQTGIEYSLDPYLRGLSGNTELNIKSARLLYGQYPPGFDLRLTIDLPLQKIADAQLTDLVGSMVLMDADSGEILVMSTSPTFDANQLEEKWANWMEDESAPLLNRVTQSLYPPGTATGGLVLARFLSDYSLSSIIPSQEWSDNPESQYFCAILPQSNLTWGKLISHGCLDPLITISRSVPLSQTLELLTDSDLFTVPGIPLETSDPVIPGTVESYFSLYSGDASLLISPLQMLIAANALSNGGNIIPSQIATGHKTLMDGWVLIDNQNETTSLNSFDASEAASVLTQGEFPGWEISSLAVNEEASISWYIAGTPPEWKGTSITLVVALEDSSPIKAKEVGRSVFLSAITPSGD